MGRLPGFDYTRPFFYMVTLKGLPLQERRRQNPAWEPPFSRISPEGRIVPNAITEAFEETITGWARFWRSVESVSPHVVMPDHLHLLVKLAAVEKAASLQVVLGDLKKRLRRAYRETVPSAGADGCKTRVLPPPASAGEIFAPGFHDWIVKRNGQLEAFRRYIRENPARAAFRRAHREFFTRTRRIGLDGREWWVYGNEALLDLPVLVAVKGHRNPPADADEVAK